MSQVITQYTSLYESLRSRRLRPELPKGLDMAASRVRTFLGHRAHALPHLLRQAPVHVGVRADHAGIPEAPQEPLKPGSTGLTTLDAAGCTARADHIAAAASGRVSVLLRAGVIRTRRTATGVPSCGGGACGARLRATRGIT